MKQIKPILILFIFLSGQLIQDISAQNTNQNKYSDLIIGNDQGTYQYKDLLLKEEDLHLALKNDPLAFEVFQKARRQTKSSVICGTISTVFIAPALIVGLHLVTNPYKCEGWCFVPDLRPAFVGLSGTIGIIFLAATLNKSFSAKKNIQKAIDIYNNKVPLKKKEESSPSFGGSSNGIGLVYTF